MTAKALQPRFFKSAEAFDAWLAKHHATSAELLLGFYKVGASKKGITYQHALDAALAYGWIDGVRRRIDDASFTIRFTPRRPRSIWSAVNIRRVGELEAAGRMRDPGRAVFAKRDEARSRVYSYDRLNAPELDEASIAAIKADATAYEHFQKQPPGYRRIIAHWITSAKKPETREKRLQRLIKLSREGQRLPTL
jgi:uncharacterized protein YdeI (YjbR/CyaY-like superfamily)